MGRVFDAIRKSSAPADNGKAPKRESKENERRNEAPRISAPLPSAREIEAQLFAGSTIMTVSGETAPGSASSAHTTDVPDGSRSEEHTSELQSPCNLVCRLLL